MTFEMTLAEHLTMVASANMNQNMKVAASNVNIKINQLFFKQRILGVHVTIAQRKTSGGLIRTGS